MEATPGFYLAAGHEGAGIGLAPVTGRLIAEWVTGAELPPFAVDSTAPVQREGWLIS